MQQKPECEEMVSQEVSGGHGAEREAHSLYLCMELFNFSRNSGTTIIDVLQGSLQMLMCSRVRGGHKLILVTFTLSSQMVLFVHEQKELRLNDVFWGRVGCRAGNWVGWGSLSVKGEQKSWLANRDPIEQPLHRKTILVIVEKGLHGRPVLKHNAVDIIFQLNLTTNNDIVSVSLTKASHSANGHLPTIKRNDKVRATRV
ncbi:hypothetical protein EDC04DRAFT_2605599 [Pisolithus marmoratus]|nr:hypothetical protein EDC04DRAFT_2605599 [Pisolithus marmoratus]